MALDHFIGWLIVAWIALGIVGSIALTYVEARWHYGIGAHWAFIWPVFVVLVVVLSPWWGAEALGEHNAKAALRRTSKG